MNIVTRIAPSPTGYLHFGLARTALYCFLYARKFGGEFVIRIEDTDAARNRPEYEADIIEQLKWLNLLGDRAYRQSEHAKHHSKLLHQLVKEGKAYLSKEPSKDDPTKEVEVVRLKNEGGNITFHDLIRGDITFDTTELKDFVIARSIEEPLYHFAVVVDDHDEGVTHVIRGDDHISNTPRQILIHKALGYEIPQYAHLPLILMPDKSKMSKRKHEVSVRHYREMGILPDALINYLALLGWTPKSQQEILTREELIAEFRLEDIHKSGAIFDIEKLLWFNKQYLLKLPEEVFKETALRIFKENLDARGLQCSDGICVKLLQLLKEKIQTWGDIKKLVEESEFDHYFYDPRTTAADIPQKGSDKIAAATHLKWLRDTLQGLSEEDFGDPEKIKAAVWDYATKEGRGPVLWPLRFTLSGKAKSPDPFYIASVIGKDATLRRVGESIKTLELS